ncbi:MAG: pyridoxamine 5'-phosphate oxidase [Dehalococcoidia bacterium]|nr:pyridoxamine 5'-phosphate oxidase [Dehalococcoidia bacterium]
MSEQPPSASEPRASRTTKPAGYWEPHPLPWGWAESRLVEARNYWIASVGASGAPHARPVWGAWVDGALCFSSGSRIVTNIEAEPRVTAHLDSGDEAVILEGTAEALSDAEAIRGFIEAFNPKYHWDFTPESAGAVIAVRPRVVFGWVSDPSGQDGGALFSASGTRWDFGG